MRGRAHGRRVTSRAKQSRGHSPPVRSPMPGPRKQTLLRERVWIQALSQPACPIAPAGRPPGSSDASSVGPSISAGRCPPTPPTAIPAGYAAAPPPFPLPPCCPVCPSPFALPSTPYRTTQPEPPPPPPPSSPQPRPWRGQALQDHGCRLVCVCVCENAQTYHDPTHQAVRTRARGRAHLGFSRIPRICVLHAKLCACEQLASTRTFPLSIYMAPICFGIVDTTSTRLPPIHKIERGRGQEKGVSERERALSSGPCPFPGAVLGHGSTALISVP